MIKFLNLKSKKCPQCGCDVVIREEVESSSDGVITHCNGERWESRKFLCGVVIKWIPNLSAERVVVACTNTDEYRENESKRSAIRSKIAARIGWEAALRAYYAACTPRELAVVERFD